MFEEGDDFIELAIDSDAGFCWLGGEAVFVRFLKEFVHFPHSIV
jgi:hypothetical protein